MLEMNTAIAFPTAPLLTVILALVGELIKAISYLVIDLNRYPSYSTCCEIISYIITFSVKQLKFTEYCLLTSNHFVSFEFDS